jgi:hypothetical protein
MLSLIYILSALTSFVCAALLLRGYWRSAQRLLLWSGVCFVGLALDNVFLFCDYVIDDISFEIPRKLFAIVGLSLLIYGMIWDVK